MSGKREARPRRGRRVSFTRADTESSPRQADTVVGLRFTVEAAHGGSALIDFVQLRPRRLALAFASALRELAPTVVRSTLIQHGNGLKRFFAFLDDTAAKIDGPEQLRAEHIDGFERWLEAIGVSTIHRHTILAKLINSLRTIDARRPGVLDDKLRRRLGYTSARPMGRSTPRDAYSGFVAKQLRDAARADIVAIAQRLRSPPPIDHPNPSLRRCLETAAAVIEAEGTVSHRHPKLSYFHSRCYLLGSHGGTPVRDLHARCYLFAEDIIPFFVLLSLETGLEPECIKALREDCLRNPASGTVEIEYMKRRARGSEWKRLRVRDGASSTPGGMIRTLIELTAAARRHKPSEILWVYFHVGRLHDRIRYYSEELIQTWVARHGIVDDKGRPLRLLFSRLRKTHKALWYAKTQGELTRFAVGHTPEVAARHYADLPSLRHLHEQTIADGLNDALVSALAHISAEIVRQLNDFRDYLNDRFGAPGAPVVPPGPNGKPWRITTRQFRRTVAWHIANRPFGTVAGMIQYKHIGIASYEGYAGSSRSGFRNEVERERALGQLDDVLAYFERHRAGEVLTGPAAARITAELKRAAEELDPLPGHVADAARVRAMLGHVARTLFVGVLNDCFFDPATALCLSGRADRSTPAMAQCRPDRCPNSCIASRHRPMWRKAIEDVYGLLSQKRLQVFHSNCQDAPRFAAPMSARRSASCRRCGTPTTSGPG